MKQTYLSLAVLLLLAGCADNDPETTNIPENKSQSFTIRVGIDALSTTKSIINGTAFTAPAEVGVYVAQGSINDATGNKGVIGTPYSDPANNVKFSLTGDEWTPNHQVSLSSATGTVYAYFPYNASTTITKDNPTIPISVTTTGIITVNGGSGATSGVNNPGTLVSPVVAETDYMYYDPTVNSGSVQPKVVVHNHSAVASLIMHHALAKVSFRVITNGSYSNGGAEGHLTKYVLADNASKNMIVTGGTLAMNLNDGTISKTSPVAGSITREIQGYTLGTDVASATIISNLVLPIINFASTDLKVVFTIDGTDYTTTLPTTAIHYWNAGSNYLYTVTLSGTDLDVATVEIIDWNNMDGGNIAIQ